MSAPPLPAADRPQVRSVLAASDSHTPAEILACVASHRAAAHEALLARHLPRLTSAHPGRRAVTWVGDTQQGDGGKGAVTDRLARTHSIVARIQGGDNCGHTSAFRGAHGETVTIQSHMLPSGIRHPHTYALIGNGVMLNPEQLLNEFHALRPHSPDIEERVLVSDRCHLVFPFHRKADRLIEVARARTSSPIGTTLRGIGPANISKVARMGIRVLDIEDMDAVARKLEENFAFFGLPREDLDGNLRWAAEYRDFLRAHAADTRGLLNAAVARGHSVLFEGGQGPLIDLEHGTYPYVTTCPTTIHSVSLGSGLSSKSLTLRLGVLKAYHTMVGNGPFVTEDHHEVGAYLRRAGNEYGTTTARPRRCGWLDLVSAEWGARINEFDSLVVTKLDVLAGLPQVKVCVAYECDGNIVEYRPEPAFLERCRPIFHTFEGWTIPSTITHAIQDLPKPARRFLDFIEAHVGVPIAAVTTGVHEEDILFSREFHHEFDGIRELLSSEPSRAQAGS